MGKKFTRWIAVIIGILLIIVLISFINHKIKLKQESKLFKPLGTMVNVNGHNMHVFTEGDGNATLVFMSGGGTCSPTLDFRSLYSLLSDDYRVAVIEKSGYGFSEISEESRDVDTILEETRKALALAGEKPPYVLFPHSVSGIEALYWVEKYPNEVAGIVGLDPCVPDTYENYSMPNKFVLNLSAFAAKVGLTRFIPSICNSSAAIAGGSLTDNEKEMYRAIFYRRTATKTMLQELECIQENAKKVDEIGTPQVPMLFFVSNGDGTGYKKEDWQKYSTQYLSKVPDSQQVFLEASHYIHDYEYKTIADKSKIFINSIINNKRSK